MTNVSTHRVSCVLPAYNEGQSLPLTVTEWLKALARYAGDYEIIVVDDGSTDDTPTRLRELRAADDRVRVLTHDTNLGYGAAIRNGFAAAKFPLLFFTDSDGQYVPDDLPRLLQHADAADVVVGYRLGRADPNLRHLLSRGYNFLVRRSIGVRLRDINCAFKLLHRDALRRLGLESTGFTINAELAMNARIADMVVVEVPVRHRPRHAGRSKVRPMHVGSGLYGLAWLRRRRRRTPVRTASVMRPAQAEGAFTPGTSLPLERNRDTAAPVG